MVGPLFGIIQIGFEFPIAKTLSLEINPTYFNVKISPLLSNFFYGYDGEDDYQFWAITSELSLNHYFSGKALEGFSLGVFGKGAYLKAAMGAESLYLGSVGGGLKAGYRWVWD